MKQRLNNKGVTLIELIVSFALVAVAIVYFYQTLYTVKKLYGEAQEDTNKFVDVNYAYRIIDASIEDEYFCDNISNLLPDISFNDECKIDYVMGDKIKKLNFFINDEEYVFYKFVSDF